MAPRKPFLDGSHPMFAKAWVRWLTTLVPLAWGVVELASGNPLWGILFAASGAYAGWVLIYKR